MPNNDLPNCDSQSSADPFDGELKAELLEAQRLARQASAAILAIKERAQANAREKDNDEGPVTEADLAADVIIREGLAKAFPDDVIVTEETWKGGIIAPAKRVWFIDPVDGTKEFVAKRPDYAVMIGLCVDGRPKLGVVLQPETGLLWRGVVGQGCQRVSADRSVTTLAVDTRVLPGAGARFAVSRNHPSRLGDFIVKSLGAQTVAKGSVGLKVALIVDDLADAYISASKRIKVWDTAGPAAICMAAGGDMTALDGSPLLYHGPAAHGAGVRATTPAAQEAHGAQIDGALQRWRR